ncbi:hypothetical protein R3W88_000040 [Solanum pinnatisectum]|uniref:NB-ARC domain-containing protein n=1 Tax=Solanum pinnatisectum TaxID=50273 RepID=A0AAV9MEK0_9SOLN|nr:hypothetical protein R3W88_000040 [Solanum pinnatisectum]
MKHLERMIQDTAHGMEDMIESHVYDSSYEGQSRQERRKAYTIFHQNLEYAIEEIGLIQREVMKKIKVRRFNNKISQSRVTQQYCTSSQFTLNQKYIIVGLDEEALKIKDRLIMHSSRLEVVPIIGMAGIGKTTLARRVYDDSLTTYHFYKFFFGILRSIGIVNCEVERNNTYEQLAERVYRSLKGRKYLIVLDDMWSIEAWQHVRRSFPDDHNGSRIVLTTRLVDVASCASSGNPLHQMRFLSVTESWTLLRDKVFGNNSYPPELEKIGRSIGHQCQGLPLAVVAIGGLLSKTSKETSSWENVSEKVGSLMTSDTMDCLNILSLSYSHLPQYLKTCFLYMGVFAEIREIPVWKLIRLWIAEGFIKKVENKNLEDVAEENLRELVDRSLVLVGKHCSLGKIKTCKMHDLVRDMCLREAQNENFIHFKTRYEHDNLLGNVSCLRRVVVFNNHRQIIDILVNSYTHATRTFRLLRILDVCFALVTDNSEAISELIHLRHLACPFYYDIMQSICELWNLQILVIRYSNIWDISMTTQSLPWELLNMPQLRHIHTKGLRLFIPRPTSLISERENYLQTLTGLVSSSCNDEVLLRIPNLKKLGISLVSYSVANVVRSGRCHCLYYLVHLTQLEKLKVECEKDRLRSSWMHRCENFPPNLKKLTLCRTYLQWEDMNILSKLPNLEVLKLKDHAFHGHIWKLSDEGEDGFLRLKFLLLEDMNLKQWEATSYHFPSLEHLGLTACIDLEKIPFDFADIQTLQLIELHKCKLSVIVSAEQIQEEQQSMGNDDLIVRMHYLGQ